MTEIKGLKEVEINLGKFGEFSLDQLALAMNIEGELTSTESQKRTPVEVGALRGSHRVATKRPSGGGIKTTISVGGPTRVRTKDGKKIVHYAIHVHENLSARHPNGQAKFLESAFRERQPYTKRLAKRLKRAVA